MGWKKNKKKEILFCSMKTHTHTHETEEVHEARVVCVHIGTGTAEERTPQSGSQARPQDSAEAGEGPHLPLAVSLHQLNRVCTTGEARTQCLLPLPRPTGLILRPSLSVDIPTAVPGLNATNISCMLCSRMVLILR